MDGHAPGGLRPRPMRRGWRRKCRRRRRPRRRRYPLCHRGAGAPSGCARSPGARPSTNRAPTDRPPRRWPYAPDDAGGPGAEELGQLLTRRLLQRALGPRGPARVAAQSRPGPAPVRRGARRSSPCAPWPRWPRRSPSPRGERLRGEIEEDLVGDPQREPGEGLLVRRPLQGQGRAQQVPAQVFERLPGVRGQGHVGVQGEALQAGAAQLGPVDHRGGAAQPARYSPGIVSRSQFAGRFTAKVARRVERDQQPLAVPIDSPSR